jgi:hypothetical protein
MNDTNMAIALSRTVAGSPAGLSQSPLSQAKPLIDYRKKSRRKSRDNYVKRRKHAISLKQGTGGINPCYRPSRGATKADLAEYHAEEMSLRRSHQLKRVTGLTVVRRKKELPR